MLNIVLLCQYGASTGMLADRIAAAAKADGVDAAVNAYSFSQIGDVIDAADVVLLGPQIRFKKAALEQQYAGTGVPFELIDTVDYGTLNGAAVLKTALATVRSDDSAPR